MIISVVYYIFLTKPIISDNDEMDREISREPIPKFYISSLKNACNFEQTERFQGKKNLQQYKQEAHKPQCSPEKHFIAMKKLEELKVTMFRIC